MTAGLNKPIKGVVTHYARRNSDRSYTFYARWVIQNDEGTETTPHCQRLFRTEAGCTGKARRDAKARARQTCNKMYDEIRYPEDRPRISVTMTLDAVKMYVMWARATNSDFPAPMAESTATRQEQALMDFINWVCDFKPRVRQVHKLTSQHTFNWVKHKIESGLNPRTILTYLSDLQSWLDFCTHNNYMHRPITLKWLRKSLRASIDGEPAKHIPTTEEVNKAITAQRDYLMRAAVFTLAATGLRSGELRALVRGNADLANSILRVNPTEREGFSTATKKHERMMPCGVVLEGILANIKPTRSGPWLFGPTEGYKQLGSQLNHRLKPHGLKPHDLRRWFNTTLENAECPQYVLDDLMGHTGDKVRKAYSSGVSVELKRKWMVGVEANLAWPE